MDAMTGVEAAKAVSASTDPLPRTKRVCVDCGARCSKKARRCQACCYAPLKRSMPEDFAAVAPTMSAAQLAAHYRCSTGKITEWLKQCGAARGEASKFAGYPLPDNFAALAPTMTLIELQVLYGRGATVINRWSAESGVRPRRRITTFVARGNRIPTAPRVHLDLSRAGGAAEFLRQYGAVYRCHETGRADAKGKFWSRNGYVLTDDEIIQRAERLGWDPERWTRIAA